MTDIHPRDARVQISALRRAFLCDVNPLADAMTYVLDALDYLSLAERAMQRAAVAEDAAHRIHAPPYVGPSL